MVKTIFAHDTAAPTAPSTSDPANFPARADAYLTYLTSGAELEIQDGASDTTSGRIPKMGNDADFANLTADTLYAENGSSGASVNALADDVIAEIGGNGGMSVLTPDANFGAYVIGSPSDSYAAVMRWQYSSLLMEVGTGTSGGELSLVTGSANEAMRIDGSGNVGIGVSIPSFRLDLEETADIAVQRIRPRNATYTQSALEVRVDRAATSAYAFAKFRSGNTSDIEFAFSGDGNGTCDGSWTGGGADYAEFFEWLDGNPTGEDRRGVAVVLDGRFIRPALAGEVPFGVISGNPSVIGDGDIDRWKDKYLRDEYGTYIEEDYEVVEWVETVTEAKTEQVQATEDVERAVIEVENGVAVKRTKIIAQPVYDEIPLRDEAGNDLGTHKVPRMVEVTRETAKEVKHSYAADAVPEGVTVPADATRTTQQRRKLNPEYDESLPYTSRAERPEWDVVGLMGKLRIRKGQPVAPNWIKMRDVSADVEEWLVR